MFGLLRNIGTGELLIIGVLILFFFGGKKFGEFAQGIRSSKKEFNKIKEELKKSDDGKSDSSGGGN